MNIALTQKIEKALKERAHKQGTSPEVLIRLALQELLMSPVATEATPENNGSLFEYLADYIGALSSSEYIQGGARMSENCGSCKRHNGLSYMI